MALARCVEERGPLARVLLACGRAEVAKIDGRPLQNRTLEACRLFKGWLGISRSLDVAFKGANGVNIHQFHAELLFR